MSDDRRSRSRSRSRSPERGGGGDNNDDNNNGPPPGADSNGDAKPDDHGDGGGGGEEVKLYVGNLDYATDEPRLREVFGAFGTVADVFLPMERGTSRPRGFGFVTLGSRGSAEDAISKMDQSQLDGRTIRVNESKPRGEGPADMARGGGGAGGPKGLGPGGVGTFNPQGRDEVKLYVGNLSFETTEESVRGMFEQYGPVSDCFLPTDRDSGRVRGFAFVTMPSKEAEGACNKVNGLELDGRTLRVNEAQPKEVEEEEEEDAAEETSVAEEDTMEVEDMAVHAEDMMMAAAAGGLDMTRVMVRFLSWYPPGSELQGWL
eukprot:CAMPEP_0201630472 /NCGR_PEP_ID=MMETSP0493-20130528/4782_1 /ASSEMBLY_ACC=CAM_ASM_000838 /TAXON_ID=420259 /ORGANISM="Thalassiosira gravida, Strain GMp14c1" /LENGTH=316 /DNA_ID=CAMNT_0048101639 /DNA_START=116 /DNA_END=1067 /DNA_ORIENTATION=-